MTKRWVIALVGGGSIRAEEYLTLEDANDAAEKVAKSTGSRVMVFESISVCSPSTGVSWESIS